MVKNVHLPMEVLDYTINKREGAYPFTAHLGLSLKGVTNEVGEMDESFVTVEERQKMLVFDTRHQRPAYAVKGDETVSKLLESAGANA